MFPVVLQQWLVKDAILISTNMLVFLSLSATFFLLLTRTKLRKLNLPPSPPKLPLIGNIHQLGSLPHRSLRALAGKYGPLMLVHLGSVPTLVVSSADLAREILKTHDLVFASRPVLRVAKRLMYDGKDVAFAPYGEYWRQVRRISVLHLLSTKLVQSFRVVREEEVELLIRKIASSCTSSANSFNLSDTLITLTNDITCRVAFGKKYLGAGKNGDVVRKILSEFLALLGAFSVGDLIPSLAWLNILTGFNARVEKNFHELDNILEKVVEDHLHAMNSDGYGDKENYDFADILLSLEKDSKSGVSLDRDSVKALILDMFAAGTDTTFTVMEWTMAELIRHPKVMKKVQEEVREIAQGKSMVVEEDIDRMCYLKLVIKESLRLHPPVPLLVPRESIGAVQLKGYDIPAKMRVMINAWAIGRDPEIWDRSEEFWPERFINSPVDFKGQHFQFIPFGGGRRGCPGILFAVSTIELALANLLYHFNWDMPDGVKGEELDVCEEYALTTHRKSSLVLVVGRHFN